MTDDEIRAHLDSAVTHLKTTNVTYKTWLKNFNAGKYKNGSEWGSAFDELRAIRDGFAPVPVPPVPGFDFGNFADGTIGGEIRDTSWNWKSPHVTFIKGGGLNGGNAVRLIADDSMTFPNQGALARIHGIGEKGGEPAWWTPTSYVARVIGMNVPPGFSNPNKVVTDEIHGPNGSGSVINLCNFQRNGHWRHYIRGNSVINGTYAFQQIFGPNDSSPVGQNNNHQDWVGGNKPVVLGEKIVHLYALQLSPTGFGSFEAYYRTPGMKDWVNCVPLKENLYVGFPNQATPYMSCYYPVGEGGQQAVEYFAGRWFGGAAKEDVLAGAFSWAKENLGL